MPVSPPVRVWDLGSGKELFHLGHSSRQSFHRSVAFSPDGERLVAPLRDGSIGIWKVPVGLELMRLKGDSAAVYSVAFSPDGSLLASGGDAVEIWDSRTGQRLLRLFQEPEHLHQVEFSPDGKTLASAGSVVQLWELETGRVLLELREDRYPTRQGETIRLSKRMQGAKSKARRKGMVLPQVEHLTFSPDGRWLVTQEGYLTSAQTRVWDLTSGQCLEVIKGATDIADIAAGKRAQPLRARGGDLETVVESAEDGRPVAWFAAADKIAAHPSSRVWAAAQGRHLYFFELNG